MVHQHFMLIPTFTVTENIILGVEEVHGFSLNIRKARKQIQKLTKNYGLDLEPDAVVENLKKITGQAPVKTKAKKSISNFKLREGQDIGAKVTLRGPRMFEFIDRLVTLTLPRVHDFRGLSGKSFDKQGNYSIGFKDQLAFPEIKAEGMEQLHGLEVVIKTSAHNKEEAYELLKQFGFPLREPNKK